MNAPDTRAESTSASASAPIAVGHDERSYTLELVISDLLRWGVIAAATVIVAGMGLTFLHHPDYFVSADALQRLTAPTNGPHSLEDVLGGLRGASGASVEMAGLLMLIALPVIRVAFSLAVFLVRKDRKFVWISAIVLMLLTVSFLLGRVE